MLGSGIVIPLLPLYAESLGASGFMLGAIVASFAISRTLVTPIFGRLSDRSGRKLFITTGLLFYAVISIGFIWVNTTFHLVILRLLHGVASGMILPIAQAYIGDITPEGEEGKWMGYANAAFFGGFGLGPLMGGLLTEKYGLDSAFLTMGGLSLLAFLISFAFLPESSRKNWKRSQHISFRKIGTSRIMRGLFTFRLVMTLGSGAFYTFLPIFTAISLGLRPDMIGVLIAVQILSLSLLQIPSGRIADILNRKAIVAFGGFVVMVFLALIPSVNDFWPLLLLLVIGSFGNAISLPAASAMVIEEGRKYGMGSTIAVFNVAFNIGMAVGPILGGIIADFLNIDSVFYFGAATILVGIILFIWLTR